MSGPAYLDAIAGHAAHAPDDPALVDPHGAYGYGELWHAVAAVAADLRRRGVAPGDRVVTALPPGAPHVAAILGVMASGAVAVPLNTRLTEPEAATFLEPLRPWGLLAGEPCTDLAGRLAARCGAVHVALAGADAAGGLAHRLGVDGNPARETAAPDPAAAAMIMGTGGTTGVPKGATWTHEGLWLYASSCQAQMEIRRTDVELYFSPFFHIALATCLLATLFAGGCGWVLPRFDEDAVLAALATGRPTRLFGAPTALARLLDRPELTPERTRSVRRVLYGSTASAPGFAERLRAGFPGAVLVTGYGATEFGAVARIRSWEAGGGLGHPVPGVRIRIVDDAGRDVPRGEVGRVLVRAPWQMRGYWGRPDETDGAFQDGAVHSGDLGRLDETGSLHLAGRAKDMIITGGENVFPIEVEGVLAGHPAVAHAAVFGVEDPLWGERVEAAVVPAAGTRLDADALRAHCRERLAGYKVPRRLHVVAALPMTPAIKVDKRRLRDVLRAD